HTSPPPLHDALPIYQPQPRREHQALLASGERDVDAPFVETEVHAAERAHRVDDEKRVTSLRIDRLANRAYVAADAGRGLVVHDEDGAMLRAQMLRDRGGGHALPPAQRNEVDAEAEVARGGGEAGAEVTVVEREHPVA